MAQRYGESPSQRVTSEGMSVISGSAALDGGVGRTQLVFCGVRP